MVAVPWRSPAGIERQMGPPVGHREHDVYVVTGVRAPHVGGHARDDLHDAEGAVRRGERARARDGDGVAQVERAERGVEGLHPFGREVAGHGEYQCGAASCGRQASAAGTCPGACAQPAPVPSVATTSLAARSGAVLIGLPSLIAATADSAVLSAAVSLERPRILRPSQATGS